MEGHWAIPPVREALTAARQVRSDPSKVVVPSGIDTGFTHRVIRRDDGEEIIFCSEFGYFEIDTAGLELAEYRADAWMKPSVCAHLHPEPTALDRRNNVSLPRLLVHACFFGGVGAQLVADLIRTF